MRTHKQYGTTVSPNASQRAVEWMEREPYLIKEKLPNNLHPTRSIKQYGFKGSHPSIHRVVDSSREATKSPEWMSSTD
jgi:hypothetical protein